MAQFFPPREGVYTGGGVCTTFSSNRSSADPEQNWTYCVCLLKCGHLEDAASRNMRRSLFRQRFSEYAKVVRDNTSERFLFSSSESTETLPKSAPCQARPRPQGEQFSLPRPAALIFYRPPFSPLPLSQFEKGPHGTVPGYRI